MRDFYSPKWIGVIALIYTFTAISVAQTLAYSDIAEIAKKTQAAVVTIIAFDVNKKVLGQGTGFFIQGEGHLITNYHVLQGSHEAIVITRDRKRYAVKSVVAQSEETDLLRVSIDIPAGSYPLLELSPDLQNVGERIIVIGTPMGLDQTVSEGIISGLREIPKVGTILQITAPISPGSSGSPVLSMNGKVIGIASFQLSKGQNLNFAVPAKYVSHLEKVYPPKTVAQWNSDEPAKSAEGKPEPARLFVDTEPKNAAVRILNIKPKFFQGIQLEPGEYHVEATAQGYSPKKRWVSLSPGEEKKLSIALETAKNNTKADYWLERGRHFQKAGQFSDAIESFSRSNQLNPKDPRVYLERAHVYHLLSIQHTKNHDYFQSVNASTSAIKDCDTAIEIVRNDPEVSCLQELFFTARARYNNTLAKSYEKLSQSQYAKQCYLKAIEDSNKSMELAVANGIDPSWMAYLERGTAHVALNNSLQAIKDFNKILRENQDDEKACEAASFLLTFAYTEYKSAGNPASPVLVPPSMMAEALCKEGKYADAINAADEALAIDPQDAIALRHRGIAYLNLKNYRQGLKDLDKALRICPRDKCALYNRALAYYSMGNYEQAIRDCNAALKLDKSESVKADACFLRGDSNYMLGNYGQAIADFNSAIEKRPNSALFYTRRGFAYAKLGDEQSFVADLKIAARLGDTVAQGILKEKAVGW